MKYEDQSKYYEVLEENIEDTHGNLSYHKQQAEHMAHKGIGPSDKFIDNYRQARRDFESAINTYIKFQYLFQDNPNLTK